MTPASGRSIAGGLAAAVVRMASLGAAPGRLALAALDRSSGIDWDGEGLLDGVDGEQREQRRALLEELARDGIGLDELRTAVAEDRLAHVPVQQVLQGDDCYTLPELAERAGIAASTLRRDLVTLGLAVPDDETKAFDGDDLDVAQAIAAFRAAGLDEQMLQSTGRVLGQSMRTAAAAVRELLLESAERTDGERDMGLRYAQLATALAPELERVLTHTLRVQLREGIRYEVIGGVELATGRLPDTVRMTVAFADLAGFTALGETEPITRVATIGDRFAALATAAARPPVRLMKLLGDGAILAGPHAPDVVSATAGLTGGTGAARGPAIPPVHAGIATGDVVLRRGEIYGATANLAARLCEVAEPGTMLADDATRAASAELDWQSAGGCRPKGFGRDIEVYTLA